MVASRCVLRKIKSFVRRENRMTDGQKRAFEQLWPKYGIDNHGLIDLQTLWPRQAPVIMEIGVGMGEALLHMAQSRPEFNFLGIDVYRPGLAVIANALEKQQMSNVRLLCGDVVEVFENQLPSHSLQEIHIYFSDPWPKKKHHKRRLIQANFLNQIYTMLASQGRVYLATDWEDYAAQMLDVFRADKRFEIELTTHDPLQRSQLRPVTKFERRAIEEGRSIWEFILQKQELRE